VRAVSDAPIVVVGRTLAPHPLDVHGWAARFVVEQALRGAAAPGDSFEIGWEELASGRAPRFTPGGLALVALEPLPPGSLWHQRFPQPGALVVATEGEAFLRDPDAATVALLGRWSQVARAEREGPAGVRALSALWAGATPRVAEDALAALNEIPGLAAKVEDESLERFASGLLDDSRPLALREGLLRLAAQRQLAALRPTIERLARRGDPLEAPALDALGALDGGLPPIRVAALLARPEPAVRAAGARHARGAQLERVAGLVKSDPAPEVRAAAIATILSQRGARGFDVAGQGLFDPDPAVRAAAAGALGALGTAAVPGLLALVKDRSAKAAAAPIAALLLAGSDGRAAVQTISETNPDPEVRKVARLALGQLGEAH
jgi:hypothetical protein